MENEIEEVNTELEEVGDTVESLETEGFMVLNTLDEAFASMIILKDQMRTIYPHWCEECKVNFMEESDFITHRRRRHKKKRVKT